MAYKSYRKQVEAQMNQTKEAALEAIGIFLKSEAQVRSPVGQYPPGSGRVGGNLRDSNDYEIDGDKVIIGNSANYSLYVHEGTFRQKPQRFLEDSVYQNAGKINQLAAKYYRSKMKG